MLSLLIATAAWRALGDSTPVLPDVPIWAQLGLAAPAYVACWFLWRANSKTIAAKDAEIAALNKMIVERTDEQAARERETTRQLSAVVDRAGSAIAAVPRRLRTERDLSQNEKTRVRNLVGELTSLIDRLDPETDR